MTKKLDLQRIKIQSFVTRLDPRDVRAGAAGETLDEVPCTLDTMANQLQVAAR